MQLNVNRDSNSILASVQVLKIVPKITCPWYKPSTQKGPQLNSLSSPSYLMVSKTYLGLTCPLHSFFWSSNPTDSTSRLCVKFSSTVLNLVRLPKHILCNKNVTWATYVISGITVSTLKRKKKQGKLKFWLSLSQSIQNIVISTCKQKLLMSYLTFILHIKALKFTTYFTLTEQLNSD